MTVAKDEARSQFALPNIIPNLFLAGVFCDDFFLENRLRYNGSVLYYIE